MNDEIEYDEIVNIIDTMPEYMDGQLSFPEIVQNMKDRIDQLAGEAAALEAAGAELLRLAIDNQYIEDNDIDEKMCIGCFKYGGEHTSDCEINVGIAAWQEARDTK